MLLDYQRVVVGFSGGLDSTVLLHVLAQDEALRSRLLAVHVNHGISPNANTWQEQSQSFCVALGVAFKCIQVQVDTSANVEERARTARYQAFSQVLTAGDVLVLAHHRDDQAETVLMRLFRGAGVEGVAGMADRTLWSGYPLFRPLLDVSREDLEAYIQRHELHCVDDESNQDTAYTRNRLRHEILPALERAFPQLKQHLARTASHCQQAKQNLDDLARADYPHLEENKLSITQLKQLSIARLTNVLRAWLRVHQVKMPAAVTFDRIIPEVIMAREDAESLVSWRGVAIRKYRDHLYLIQDKPSTLESQVLRLPEGAVVRYRVGGETMVHNGQTKSLKKLFQEWGVPPWERDSIPLIYINGELKAVYGYTTPALPSSACGRRCLKGG